MNSLGMLRAIRQDELERVLTWRNAESVRRNMYSRHLISTAEHLKWWNSLQGQSDRRYFMYECSGVPLGVVGFSDLGRVDAVGTWAFYADPEAPKGTGSKMEFLALDMAFGELALTKLRCEVLEFNTAVLKLHQKFGFRIEDVPPKQHLYEGEQVGIVEFGLLSAEWQEKRPVILEKLVKVFGEKS
ncbi:UDP-4-amino-4,6-dideoxy-N-acetyl-beta-L-altrosamine N-acetyltransferase [Pseudomonas syringae group sp. J309-1]|uniref:UDP-4-amino-4, 6-dideoxy-N-acetyl-beta-L-altrosamine N-acetyltransferase n=1 Tax=Pseudomonas syringae group sp. J309-1 TaxID=3079588 RepID=UPI00290F870E|nr:UDP-4-amino-4,6-dideoxy-N-acetyl-beta-L-altrosamine N-acetyltransferase [Pseudomonas syringae group sp. J309-1]MDU8361874.1 UDP-4-amino-4,6-dideoxy-N-acetyl-beta-L-altrosamine N-acetyltransferase [Pseudomonas syringae group sp. J309-1]